MKLKDLDVREEELALEYKAKGLELHSAKTCTVEVSEVPVDIRRKTHPFRTLVQESEVEKYFMHFEKVTINFLSCWKMFGQYFYKVCL